MKSLRNPEYRTDPSGLSLNLYFHVRQSIVQIIVDEIIGVNLFGSCLPCAVGKDDHLGSPLHREIANEIIVLDLEDSDGSCLPGAGRFTC